MEKGEAGEKATEEFQIAAKTLKDHAELVLVDFDDAFTQSLCGHVGITKEMLPTIRLLQPTPGNFPKKYGLKKDITAENINDFFIKFQNNEIGEYRKSEPIPEKDNSPVRTVVGDNFDDIVLDGSKDVLIEFYSPWCSHCEELAPIYEAVGKRLASVKHLIIAKIDATANDVENYPVTSYPSVKFFPARNKKPVDYEGEKTADAMIAWLRKKATWAKWPKNSEEL